MTEQQAGSDKVANGDPGPAPVGTHSNGDGGKLAESIEDASLLVWFASKRGISNIDKSTIEVLTKAKENFHSKRWNASEEAQFWDNYRIIAKAISPVSVDSVKASYDLGAGENRTRAKKAVRIYSIFTLTVLFSLIILQAYWFIGESMTKDIGDLRAIRQETQLNMRAVDLRKKIAEETRSQFREDLDAMTRELEKVNDNERRKELLTQINALKENLKNSRSQWMQEDFEIEKIKSSGDMEIKNIDYKLVGSYKFLDAWDFYSERLDQILGVTAAGPVSLGQVKQQDEVRRLAPQTRVALSAKLDEETARRAQEQLRQQQEQLLRQQQEQRQQLEGRKREMALLATKSVLGIFNQYLLPLMYGLLGSLAYILRTLTREIHDVTYTQDSNVGYRLRWPLGMLAGVTIGWFFDPDALEGAASITPLGLAFLAGYSVELLFTGLDRIVGAFTGPQGQVKGPAGA